MPEEQHLATRCVHAGELKDAHGSPHTPIYATTTFLFPDTAAILDVVEGRAAGALYTRYGLNHLGGHSDLTAGALIDGVWNWRKNLGTTPAPETAALLARSLRTLVVRVRAQNGSALAIARAMEGHPRVARVLYPGLESFPGHALAARQMSGFGGMLTIELAGGGAAASAVVDRLRLFAITPSLGGVESLATQPITTTHHGLGPEERARRGIADGMIRLSIGLEDPEDLIADLLQALR